MPIIEEIQEKIRRDQFEFSKHAVDQSIVRSISVQELREAIFNGEIIEDYPGDKYGPSCLIFVRPPKAGHCISIAAIRHGNSSRL